MGRCPDPDCTDDHGDEAGDSEDFAIYEQGIHSMNERMRNR